MKTRGLSVFLFLVGCVLAAHSSDGQPVNPTQLMAWLTSGVPGKRLVRIVQERGFAGVLSKDQIRQLEAAGADPNLIRNLTSANAASDSSVAEIPALVLKAATDAHAQRFHEAELTLRQALAPDPQNAALHFALGTMLRQQERWDDAFDEISAAAQLMPDFPENHSSLAYIFYRLDDGPHRPQHGPAKRRRLPDSRSRAVLQRPVWPGGACVHGIARARCGES